MGAVLVALSMLVALLVAANPALASPEAAGAPAQAASAGEKTCFYTPVYGETLSRIAQRYGTSVRALVEMNGFSDPDRIVAGATLVVPCRAATSGNGDEPPSRGICATYTVRWGDTLALIARHYGTTAQAIAQANRLAHLDVIIAGRRLSIPCSDAPPQPGGSSGGSFISTVHGYAVKYPADWKVSDNRSVPAGAGSNPEYVTLQPKRGGLPVVEIDTLTGVAPSTGFEDCQPTASFAGMKACRITQPAGQNPPRDLWVFERGDEHYMVSVVYEDAGGRAAGIAIIETFDFTR